METKAKHAGGRPEIYTQELADLICEKISNGASMRTACKPDDMPSISTLFKWIREKPEFSQQYAKATEERTEAMSEDILDIADDGTNDFITKEVNGVEVIIENKESTNRSRLRVDMKPKKYGDKLDMTSDGKAIQGNTIIFKDFKDAADSQ
jgi:hypothetical protein